MGFRTVVVKNRTKLDLRLNYLVSRGEEEVRIFIPEISTLILESTAISLTTALISELMKNNVKIILCDEKHNPESEICAYYGIYNPLPSLLKQIDWDKKIKELVWMSIVQEKIRQQKKFLKELNLIDEYQLLSKYCKEVKQNDYTNREGHAAKVYFNALWGVDFCRRKEGYINSALNYGYSVMLACFNRVVVSKGYLTQLGIWHKNEFNKFNLSCDLMEPFRIIVDRKVFSMEANESNFKSKVLEIFEEKVIIDKKEQFIENAIAIYVQSILDALNKKDLNLIKFYE